MPHVTSQKRALLRRLRERRPSLAPRIDTLQQLSANLTEGAQMRDALRAALKPLDGGTGCKRVIFVLEALLIYLPPAAASDLLAACVDEAAAVAASSVTLCFADRLPNAEGCGFEQARDALANAGLELEEASWLPKPGLARHMGCARWEAS